MKKRILVLLLLSVLLMGPGQSKEANSFALAVAPAVMMNVASALVVGGAMYYCWTHGGEESWAQLQSATKDGVEVTKDWLISKIAEMHDISISLVDPLFKGSPDPGSWTVTLDDAQIGSDSIFGPFPNGKYCESSGTWSLVYDHCTSVTAKDSTSSTSFQFVCDGQGYTGQALWHTDYDPSPSFNMNDYPNLYGPQVLYTNAYNALKEGIPPVLDWIMRDDAPAIDPDKDQVATVPVVAGVDANATVNPWGSDAILGEDGKYYPAPPALVDPDTGLPLERPWPELDGASVGGNVVEGVNGVAPINKPLDQLLNDAGIVGGTINGVQGNTITWTDADGVSHVAVVPNDVADQVRDLAETTGAASDAKENTQKNIEKETALLTDPGHIDVPFFDPEFEQPEKQDVATVMDTLIDLLPGADLLTDSSIEASGSPVMTLTFPGFDPVNLDFSSYESNVSSIGSILFTIVCLGCLIAVVKG
jgi:hypothetical protein